MTPELLNYGEAAGYGPLRAAIAGYVGPTRGVTCRADQVVITAGTAVNMPGSTNVIKVDVA